MQSFIKKNPWLFLGLIIAALISLVMVHKFGFWGMNKTISIMPERLRDMTFPVWDKYSYSEHGFLVFTTKKDFDEGVAYSNHSSVYLFFMYLFYKIEMSIPQFSMRVVVAYLEMTLLISTLTYILIDTLKERVKFNQCILILLAMIFLVTMPDFWISAGKFNVDNLFHLQFPLLLLIAYRLSRDELSGIKLWFPLGLLCVLSPISAALLGAYLAVTAIKKDGFSKELLKLSAIMVFISIAIYLQPVMVSKILRFSSSNSEWIFRAGLDGDVSNFNNVVNSVTFPFYPRPFYLILAPISLLLIQLAFIRFGDKNDSSVLSTINIKAGLFYGILFSQYLVTILLWPQSVSIHPYLYDFMLVGPVYTWIVLNFVSHPALCNNPRVWIWIMLFFISFNLQQIAQAQRCFYCFYPSWTPNQYVIKP